jgi:hypothetical protein
VRQHGRKGALQREMMAFTAEQNRRATIHNFLPPPDELEQPEKDIWKCVVAQRNFNAAAAALLHSGLRMRAIARNAQQVVAKDGMMVAGRYGPRLHPMLRVEKSARYLFYQIFKQLHVQMEFDDDDFV